MMISSDDIIANVVPLGASLTSLRLRSTDRELIVGPEAFSVSDCPGLYLGSVLGRFSRIVRGGRFEIDGHRCQLSRNAGVHHLHGGRRGFSHRFWSLRDHTARQLVWTMTSPHADEGYPGTLRVEVGYRLEGTTLATWFEARTDAPTLCALSLHPFFNLADAPTIDGHELRLESCRRLIQNAELLPDGRFADHQPFEAGALLAGQVVDDFFVSTRRKCRAELRAPDGLTMTIASDQPGIAVYTGDQLPIPRHGICIQSSAWPDAPNVPGAPPSILRPGEVYSTETTYTLENLPWE